MTPKTPLLMVSNVFDRVNQYPDATIAALSEVVGHEGYRISTYRRDRQWWQATGDAAGNTANYVRVDLGAGVSAATNYLFIDRGHNLWGRQVFVNGGSTSDIANDDIVTALTVPALGTVGGDPTSATMCVTEEGALYSLYTALAARRYWRVAIGFVADFTPAVPTIMLGTYHQLLGYSATFDEDAGGRKQAGGTAESDAGYRASGRTYSWRTLDLDLKYIGASEYDGTMRNLRSLLFERAVPCVAVQDYGTNPERAWMYQLDGDSWSFGKSRVYRSGRIRLREMAPRLGR